MRASLIDGKELAEEMRAELAPQVEELTRAGVKPGLVVVLVGEDPASRVYVRMKHRACEKIGIFSDVVRMPDDTSQEQLLAEIERLNNDSNIHGILVQLPLPDHMDSTVVLESIDPAKDVDGFHPVNVGRVATGDPKGFRPATPYGVQKMLIRYGVETSGANVVIVGRSNIVGRPMASILLQYGEGDYNHLHQDQVFYILFSPKFFFLNF